MSHACQNMRERIADYVLGALNDEQAKALQDHLDGCADCRQYLHELESQGEALIAYGAQVEAGMAARCDKVIDALGGVAPGQTRSTRILPLLGGFARTAVAAVLILGAGITIGRVTGPRPVDVEQLRTDVQASVVASLKPALQASALAELDRRLDAALAESNTQLAAEIAEQMRQDLRLFASDFVSVTQDLVDRRFGEVVELIEAGRQTDRRQVAKALDQIKAQTGRGFLRLAALTEEPQATLQN
jgi:hypothetical protein